MNHFQSLRSYEDFIYDLPILFPVVVYSTLVAVRISAKQVRVAGEVVFSDAYRMVVRERIDIADDHLLIRHYGYEACVAKKSSIGMIRKRIPMIPRWRSTTRTTSMCRRISSTTASPRPS